MIDRNRIGVAAQNDDVRLFRIVDDLHDLETRGERTLDLEGNTIMSGLLLYRDVCLGLGQIGWQLAADRAQGDPWLGGVLIPDRVVARFEVNDRLVRSVGLVAGSSTDGRGSSQANGGSPSSFSAESDSIDRG